MYSSYLYSEILERAEAGDRGSFYLMSKSHILTELLAHLDVWFSPVAQWFPNGELYVRSEVATLNVNENRKGVLFLMRFHGYSNGEVLYEK